MGCLSSKPKPKPYDSPPLAQSPPQPQNDANKAQERRKRKRRRKKSTDNSPDTKRFVKEYDVRRELGKGHFAKVYECVEKKSGQTWAVKVLEKNHLSSVNALREEVKILKKIGGHPNVLTLHDAFEDKRSFYIITELCSGGDLFSRIVSDGQVSEKRSAEILRQLASALQFMHSMGVTHRDLKPENIMLMSKDPDAAIKVGDFGLSKIMQNRQNTMSTVCGTWAYCAPEVIAREPYTQAVDVWTVGVLMYILLAGYHPFDVYGELPEAELMQKIEDCEYDFNDEVWTEVSDDAKEIIRRLLQVDSNERMTLSQLLRTPWIVREAKDACNEKAFANLDRYNAARQEMRVALRAVEAAQRFRSSLIQARSRKSSLSTSSLSFYSESEMSTPEGSMSRPGTHSPPQPSGVSVTVHKQGRSAVPGGVSHSNEAKPAPAPAPAPPPPRLVV